MGSRFSPLFDGAVGEMDYMRRSPFQILTTVIWLHLKCAYNYHVPKIGTRRDRARFAYSFFLVLLYNASKNRVYSVFIPVNHFPRDLLFIHNRLLEFFVIARGGSKIYKFGYNAAALSSLYYCYHTTTEVSIERRPSISLSTMNSVSHHLR